jgi:peptidyl-prolyl cis-trans isomerase C
VRSLDLRRGLLTVGRSRVVQFFAIGAVVWAMAPAERRSREVVVDGKTVASALLAEQARVGRPLLPEEKQSVMAELVADEILVREGLRLGVGTDDAVVRARIADRMRGHLEAASLAPVTAEEARAEADRQAARMPVRVRLAVAFLSKERANATAEADALARSLASPPNATPPYGGDRAPLEAIEWWREEDLARAAGPGVARAALDMPLGTWSAPIASAWGFYIVKPLERRTPTAAEAMDSAAAEVRHRKRADALARAVARVTADYDVTVQTPAGEPPFDKARAASGALRARGRGDGVD